MFNSIPRNVKFNFMNAIKILMINLTIAAIIFFGFMWGTKKENWHAGSSSYEKCVDAKTREESKKSTLQKAISYFTGAKKKTAKHTASKKQKENSKSIAQIEISQSPKLNW